MILLDAVILGLVAGVVRSRLNCQAFQVNPPEHLWLLFLMALLQALAIYSPVIPQPITEWLAPILFVGSQVGLLVFIWLNRRQPGFLMLGAGLALNLLVIAANGGWMPVSPRAAAALFPNWPAASIEPGLRIVGTKDIVLLPAETRLWCLSDCFLTPAWFPQRAAFSPGDILIAAGAFWALWVRGGKSAQHASQSILNSNLSIE